MNYDFNQSIFFLKITQLRLKKYYVSHYYVLTIRYQNNHVSPTEIEAILQTHPDVKESLVFGKKDPRVQELISAVVVLLGNYPPKQKKTILFEKSDFEVNRSRRVKR